MSDPVSFTYATESAGTCNPPFIYLALTRSLEISNTSRVVADWCKQYALMKCNSHYKCA